MDPHSYAAHANVEEHDFPLNPMNEEWALKKTLGNLNRQGEKLRQEKLHKTE
jgi:hypothetical protein